MTKEKLLLLLKDQLFGIVSTVDAETGKPHAALVAFSETDAFELIFGTMDDTRKFKNLIQNSFVSFVVSAEMWTIQYEGVAKVAEGPQVEEYRNIHLKKNPESKKYAFHEKQKFIKIAPRWIRYTDIAKDPQEVLEIKF